MLSFNNNNNNKLHNNESNKKSPFKHKNKSINYLL